VDPVSGVRFAVKRLSHDTLTASTQHRAAARLSLQREIEVLRSVDHPHVVRLLGFSLSSDDGDSDGGGSGSGGGGNGSNDICLVYELGEGGSIADVLADDARATAFSWRHRVRALTAVASCLNYLHRSHRPPIFHRDVKSANVVLTADMQVGERVGGSWWWWWRRRRRRRRRRRMAVALLMMLVRLMCRGDGRVTPPLAFFVFTCGSCEGVSLLSPCHQCVCVSSCQTLRLPQYDPAPCHCFLINAHFALLRRS
jgi:serine/threonine protein kinase